MDAPKKTFKVPEWNLDALKERISQINKRVARLVKRGYADAKPVVIEVGPLYPVKQPCSCPPESGIRKDCLRCHGTGFKPDRIFADVTLLSPEPPRAGGWEFVAALSHVEGVGTVLRVCPGAKVAEGELARYREASSDNCDHCHSVRRRNDTFILRKLPT